MRRADAMGAVAVVVTSAVLFTAAMGSLAAMGYGVATRADGAGAGVARAPIDDAAPVSRVPVLCYHALRGRGGPLRVVRVFAYVVLSLPVLDDDELWRVNASTFERQMRWLHDHGYTTITLDELDRWQRGEIALPPRPVAITFDDGDRSLLEHALPVLRRFGQRATLFVVSGRVGGPWEGLDMMSWAELRELADSGVFAIESHTHDLHRKVTTRRGTAPVFLAAARGWTTLGDDDWRTALRADLVASRTAIRRHLGRAPRFLAWPYGSASEAIDAVAREAGFSRTAEMLGGVNGRCDVPCTEPIARHVVTARTSFAEFRAIVRGEKPDDPS